jgi:UDP-N-acetylmuramoyl-L-alanyl-D-glutamate--2,6-diaminopimelate ligase
MQLSDLLSEVPGIRVNSIPDLEISMISADSRQVEQGGLFVAIRGTTNDGHRYLEQAVTSGAAVAVGQDEDPGLRIPYFQVDDSGRAYAHIAATWHGFPARNLIMIGITGTDGKTTTAMALYEILRRAGLAVGLISTVQAKIRDQSLDTGLHVTTPDPMDLQSLLGQMTTAGLTHCILEATSHGLAQQRVAACEFDIGVVTNITHEHLDFHGSYDAYREAKGRLFVNLGESPSKPGVRKLAILNRDDESYTYLRGLSEVRARSYGFHPAAEILGGELHAGGDGIRFSARIGTAKSEVRSPLLGGYNASNLLAAVAAASGLEIDAAVVVEALEEFAGVPGRMERIDLGQAFTAIVDFAHTPNALGEALRAARGLTSGRLISVFGSAGLRDREKRRMMAEISSELADLTVLTAEDPRTEPLSDILQEMADGALASGGIEGESFWRIPDRGEAIRFAIGQAQEADLVIACGKGHEQSMCFGETEYPWDDRIAMRAALADQLGVEGPDMPQLPTSD